MGTFYVRVKSYSDTGAYSLVISGPIAGSGGGTLPAPVLATFSVLAQTVGDAPVTLTPPTSNSGGAFSYASSDASGATTSGSTATVFGGGSALITARRPPTRCTRAYVVDSSGAGKVFGTNACFFVKPTGAPEVLVPGSVLTRNLSGQAVNVYKVRGTSTGSNTLDMNTFTGAGGSTQTWSVDRGTLTVR